MILSARKGWIGVDIGSQTVKLAQVERHGGRLDLVDAAVIRRREPRDEDWGPDSAPMSSQDEIRACLVMASGIRGRRAACQLSMGLYDTWGLHAEGGSDAEMRESVEATLKSVAGNLDNRIYDFWDVDDSDPRNDENVNVMTLTNSWANQVATDLQASGLYAETLDGAPLCLARAVGINNQDMSAAPVLALDWGFSRATVTIVVNRRPMFVRSLRHGGFGVFAQALCKSLGLTLDEAQKVLTEYGLPPADASQANDLQQVIGDIGGDALKTTFEELDRTIGYINMHRRTQAPTAIWMFGGGATVKNIEGYVSQRTGLPTRIWSLGSERMHRNSIGEFPVEMLGSAVALSALAWS